MEQINNFYEKARIYKIVDNTNQNIYIGSTCKTLAQRLGQHRSDYNRFINGKNKKRVTSYEIIKNSNYNIYLIEECPCKNIEQLRARERFYIESLKCVNKAIPGRTNKEYYEDNKDKRKEYYEDNIDIIKQKKREYYEENKDLIKEKVQEYREVNIDKIRQHQKEICLCLCGGKYTLCHKLRHEKTKKHILFNNKDKIHEHKNEKCLCLCGGKYTISHKSEHERTKKHILFNNKDLN